MRVVLMLILVIVFASCDTIPFLKKQELPKLDTIVDFTSVDLSPSFKVCDSLVDKQKKSDCFRVNIHQKIGEELQQYALTSKDSIKEVIILDLLINAKGNISIDNLQISSNLKEQLPQLDSLLKNSVNRLPKIYPAIKRGIPVTTQYQLPIQIKLQE